MAISESRKKANKKYINANYATLSVKLPKTDIVFELLDKATQSTNQSKAQYIRNALLRQFVIDHIIDESELNADQPGRLDTSNSAAAGHSSELSPTLQYLMELKKQREESKRRIIESDNDYSDLPF